MKYIVWFDESAATSVALVGGKNAALAEMIRSLSQSGIMVPPGFAITSHAFHHFITYNQLADPLQEILQPLDQSSTAQEVRSAGLKIRKRILKAEIPDDLSKEIANAYSKLSRVCNQDEVDVAVRSSATAEDLPSASFAGQLETYLHVKGAKSLLTHCKQGFASLYTDRAISYRIQKGFKHEQVALSLGIQKMVRSDLACSGVAFSLDTESGFKDAIVINGSYGLGEAIVQGIVSPDEFWVYKPTVFGSLYPILKKQLGTKKIKFVYSKGNKGDIKRERVSAQQVHRFCLNDHEIIDLARQVSTIEKFFSQQRGSWCPIDVEWAKDGKDGPLYIVQARPETVHAQQQGAKTAVSYRLVEKATPLATGISIGKHIAVGKVRLVKNFTQVKQVKPGDIVVTPMTEPDWVPLLSKAAGIVTYQGGRTCHAAIVSRELAIPAIVGAQQAEGLLKNGLTITLDCSSGLVGSIYKGALAFEKITVPITQNAHVDRFMMMLSDPRQAFQASTIPNAGVGLLRLEFAIAQTIKIHPLACIYFESIPAAISKKIVQLTAAYASPVEYYVQLLSQAIATIAAAFAPKPVYVRLSDFKTNEYANMIGGSLFEPQEGNPMLGLRGARRYYDALFQPAFELECRAIDFVRRKMGFTSVHIMVPFVRDSSEAEKVVKLLAAHGLQAGKDSLKLSMMVETPENALMLSKYADYFDHFSIGSNDLTQLTLGIDRDNAQVAALFDESNPAVMKLIELAIKDAHQSGKQISLCGQGPSDNPQLAAQLLKKGIDTLVLTQDALLTMLSEISAK